MLISFPEFKKFINCKKHPIIPWYPIWQGHFFEMVDRKGAYVNIPTNTDSIVNPDNMFQKIINNQNKSLEIIIKDPCSLVNRNNIHYNEMSLFDTFYEDYIDFKNYSVSGIF